MEQYEIVPTFILDKETRDFLGITEHIFYGCYIYFKENYPLIKNEK